MNKRGSLGIVIISSIMIFMVGMIFLNFLMPEVTDARVNLNCSSASLISDGTKLLCLVIDTNVPYWILLVFSVTIGGILAKFYL